MDINQRSINYLKALTADTISNAQSGHTGTALGASSILFALFKDHLQTTKLNPNFISRDRFVLSAGHSCALLYSLFYMFNLKMSIDDLKNFRKYGSNTPGHPETSTDFVDCSSGPLGQGVANAVGLAIAEKFYKSKLNTKRSYINSNIYAFCGDGCLMEGVAQEAISLAGTLKLDNLILLYDKNNITIDGKIDISNTEKTDKKFKAMNWNVIKVKNGNSYRECTRAIARAKHSSKPTVIIFNTIIGIGTKLQNKPDIHAHPLSKTELKNFKKSLGIDTSFYVPEQILDYCRKSTIKNDLKYQRWLRLLDKENNSQILNFLKNGKQYINIDYKQIAKHLLSKPEMAGRDIASKILNEIAKCDDMLIGGAADVASSTKASIEKGGNFSRVSHRGKNIHFGIREHSMSAICNGISLFNGTHSYNATFMAFSNYMIPAIRMSTLMKLPVISIFSHDSLNVGQDGITHQPIEQLSQLRSITGNYVFRPANKIETLASFKFAYQSKLPTSIVVAKSTIHEFGDVNLASAEKGGYVAFESKGDKKIEIFATGSEVFLAIDVAKKLKGFGVKVISMPCEKIFARQEETYKNKVLEKDVSLKVAIEASNDNLWYKYIGENGLFIGIDAYQKSGDGSEVYQKAGFNTTDIVNKIIEKIAE